MQFIWWYEMAVLLTISIINSFRRLGNSFSRHDMHRAWFSDKFLIPYALKLLFFNYACKVQASLTPFFKQESYLSAIDSLLLD